MKKDILMHDVCLIFQHFFFLEYEDGDLSSWINRERFQGYLNVDGFTLYELGDTGEMLLPLNSLTSFVLHTKKKVKSTQNVFFKTQNQINLRELVLIVPIFF